MNDHRITHRREFLKHRVHSMQSTITTLQAVAEREKSNPSHGVHARLRKAEANCQSGAGIARLTFENSHSPHQLSQPLAKALLPGAMGVCCWRWRGDRCRRKRHGFVRPHMARCLGRCRRRRNRTEVVPVAIELCAPLGLARGLYRGRCPLLEAAKLLDRFRPSIRLKNSGGRF
jgi:hypothetical protein